MVFFIQIMVIVSILVFVIGLIKPRWVLFWMKAPDRLWASSLGLFMFMAFVTAYSEIRLKHKSPQQREAKEERSLDRRNDLQLSR